jgi:hypothetical protein
MHFLTDEEVSRLAEEIAAPYGTLVRFAGSRLAASQSIPSMPQRVESTSMITELKRGTLIQRYSGRQHRGREAALFVKGLVRGERGGPRRNAEGAEVVGINFIIELTFLGGRERLSKYPLFSMISY